MKLAPIFPTVTLAVSFAAMACEQRSASAVAQSPRQNQNPKIACQPPAKSATAAAQHDGASKTTPPAHWLM
ncbi:MAG: hypothetical protein Q7S40_33275 [Opitutaceae bacterium]|nr:hypothetical protein [Opitutaceae bacterium]